MDNGILWGKFSLPDIYDLLLYSPNGKYLVSFNYCRILINDAKTGELINIIPDICFTYTHQIRWPGIRFFINNSDSLFLSYGYVNRIYEIPSGKMLSEFSYGNKDYQITGYSKDARYIIESFFDFDSNRTRNQFMISDLKTNQILFTDSAFTKSDSLNTDFYCLGLDWFSPDGKYFSLWSDKSGNVHNSIFDIERKKMIWHDNFNDYDGDVIRATFINNENNLIIVGMKNLYVVDFLKDTILQKFDYPQKYGPSPRPVYLLSNDNCVLLDFYYLFNYKTGQFTDSVYFEDIEKFIPYKVKNDRSFGGFCISGNDSLALFSYGGYIYEYGTYSKKLLNIVGGGYTTQDETKLIIKPKFINNDSELVVIGNMGTVIWDSKIGKAKYHCTLYTSKSYGMDVDVMSDKKDFIYTVGNSLIFYDYQNDSIRKKRSFDFNFEKIIASNNDKYVGLISGNMEYLVYDIELDSTVIIDLCKTENASIYFSQNSKYFVVSDSLYTSIWSLETKSKIKQISTGYIANRITNDGKYLIGRKAIYDYPYEKDNLTIIDPLLQSNKNDFTIKKELKNTAYYHLDYCIMSNNKNIAVCSSADSSIRVLNIETGEIVKKFDLQNFSPHRLALANNEEYLASLDFNDNMIVWDFKKLMVSVNPNDAQIFISNSNPSFFDAQNKGIIALTYNLKEFSKVSITIYDLLGQIVYHSNDDKEQALGQINFDLDANCFRTGIYFYLIQTDTQIERGRFIKY